MKKIKLLLAVCLLLFTGCGPRAQPDAPPRIRWGEDTCAFCKMIASEARYAGGYTAPDGRVRAYDDLGCLFRDQQAHRIDPTRLWVMDYERGIWLKATKAFYVRSEALHTPMDGGLVAVQSRLAAERIVARHGGHIETFQEAARRTK